MFYLLQYHFDYHLFQLTWLLVVFWLSFPFSFPSPFRQRNLQLHQRLDLCHIDGIISGASSRAFTNVHYGQRGIYFADDLFVVQSKHLTSSLYHDEWHVSHNARTNLTVTVAQVSFAPSSNERFTASLKCCYIASHLLRELPCVMIVALCQIMMHKTKHCAIAQVDPMR